jgi:dTDP-4-dehydrorhamnose reductase
MQHMLITGASGRLGRTLRQQFPDALTPSSSDLDILKKVDVERYLKTERPATVIHAAALTDVAAAETDHQRCWNLNVQGTENLVACLHKCVADCHFVYISTACVFSGSEGNYSEDSIPAPRNFYGLTKLVGEYVARRMPSHLIVRTNFVDRSPWPFRRAFTDRFGTYLFANDVAWAIRNLIESGMQGLVHVAGDKRLSMHNLANMISPGIETMTMADTDLPLTVDMSLRSVRIPSFQMTFS